MSEPGNTSLQSHSRSETIRCTGCKRPAEFCFCSDIPEIDNQTEIVILQHRREQFHAMNTARIVAQSLRRCQLIAQHTDKLAERFAEIPLSKKVGLLFPGPEAQLLSELNEEDHPDQLIILDGTWSHAKTLFRDLPRLKQLPRYRLDPASPSRYRIRREPNAEALSTLEATVAALRELESTAGLDRLLNVFDQMIDDQIEHPKSNWRKNGRRRRGASNIPRAVSSDLDNLVVAYGEQRRGGPEFDDNSPRIPVYWVARRLGDGSTFRCAIKPNTILDSDFLSQMRLSADHFHNAVSIEQFRRRWNDFLRPSDIVTVYHPSTARMIDNVDPGSTPPVILKSVKVAPRGNLDDVVRSLGIEIDNNGPSRADERLACAIGLVHYLHELPELPPGPSV